MAAQKHPQTLRRQRSTLATANTTYADTTGTYGTVAATGATGGSLFYAIQITAKDATVLGGAIRFHESSDAGTTKKYMGVEIPVRAVTPIEGVTAPWSYRGPIPGGPIELPTANDQIYLTTVLAEAFNVIFIGYDYV